MFEGHPLCDLGLKMHAMVLELFENVPLLARAAERRDKNMGLLQIRRHIHRTHGDENRRKIQLAEEDDSELTLEDFADPFETVFHDFRGMEPLNFTK